MKVSELLAILQPVPGNFDVEIFYGHSQLDIVSTGTSTFGKALVLTCEEERDLSDPEKHEDAIEDADLRQRESEREP